MPPTFPSLTQPVMSGPHPDLAPLPSNTAVVPLPSWHVPTYPPIRYSGWQLQVRVSQPASCKSCWVLGPTVATTTNFRQRARARAFTSRLRSWVVSGRAARAPCRNPIYDSFNGLLCLYGMMKCSYVLLPIAPPIRRTLITRRPCVVIGVLQLP